MQRLIYPKSFPRAQETAFLRLIVCADADFQTLWHAWRTETIFDDIDIAILRLLPLLYLRLKALSIVDNTVGRIKGVYRMTWYKNHLLLKDAEHAIAVLQAAYIDPIVLKGVSLVQAVYKDVGARGIGDIDLLVAPSQAFRAASALVDAGWKLEFDARFISANSLLRRFADPKEQTFVREVTLWGPNGSNLDLHTALFNFDSIRNKPHAMTYDVVAPATRVFSLGGRMCRMLGIEDLLLHVIAHGAPESEHRALRWVCDVATLLQTFSIDWNMVVERAVQFELVLETRVGLTYLLKDMKLPIPTNVLQQLHQFPVDTAYVKEYYARGGKVQLVRMVGVVPMVWLVYWKYYYRGIASIVDFPQYLCRVWLVDNAYLLPWYCLDKFKKHIQYTWRRL